MSRKVGYYAGLALGIILVYGLYAIGIYGVVWSLINKEVPYIPLILILVIFSARKLAQIQFYLETLARIDANRKRVVEKENEIQRIVSKIYQSGGNN